MKNVILGITGAMLMVWLSVFSLGIYRLTTERALLEEVLSRAMEETMRDQYVGEAAEEPLTSSLSLDTETGAEADTLAREEVWENVCCQVPEAQLQIEVCDMEKGLLAVTARETIALPTGTEREVEVRRVLLVDRAAE